MFGCSKQAWLNKGKMPRNPAHKRVLKKVSTQPMNILNKDFEKCCLFY
jgi:hypothetical protein